MAADALLTKGRWVVSMAGGGIYESRDAGASWSLLASPVGTDVGAHVFPVLAPDADGESFLAGSANDGVFRVALGAPVGQ
jgi:hypothetical protein